MSNLDEAFRVWIRDAIRDEMRDLPRQLASLLDEGRAARSASPTYLTAEEVAELAKVRPQTVRSWVSSKALPGHYAGRKLRIRLDELEAFMQRDSERQVPDKASDDVRVREILASIND